MKKMKEKRVSGRAMRLVAFLAFVAAALAAPLPALAADEAAADPGNPSVRRLNRGFQNTVLGWAELPQGIREIGERHGVGAAATWGLVFGSGRAIQRTAIGIFEVLTFPFGFGQGNKPLIEPEYVLSKYGRDQ